MSPSGAERWMECPASLRLSKDLPELPSTQASRDGTVAHRFAEWAALGVPDETIRQLAPSAQVAEWALEWRDGLEEWAMLHEGELLIEQRLVADEWGHCWGTADAVGIAPDRLLVADFKSGRWPCAPDSAQLRIYGLGALRLAQHLGKNPEVDLMIFQPRNGGWKEQTFDGESFMLERDAILEARVMAPTAAPRGGEWCHFCRARASCPASQWEARV